MFGIVVAIIAIICCLLVVLNAIARERLGTALLFFLLLILNVYILVVDIKKYRNPDEYETHIVHNVEGYSIDSTMTINGVDTTKTYTITYWK